MSHISISYYWKPLLVISNEESSVENRTKYLLIHAVLENTFPSQGQSLKIPNSLVEGFQKLKFFDKTIDYKLNWEGGLGLNEKKNFLSLHENNYYFSVTW